VVSEDLHGVKIRTLDLRQGFGESGIAGRQSFRDFAAQPIGTVCPGPVSLFREQIAEPQATPDLREPDPGFRWIGGSQVPVNIRRYLAMACGPAEAAVILQETCYVVVGASQ
jgi:hypothetical protein